MSQVWQVCQIYQILPKIAFSQPTKYHQSRWRMVTDNELFLSASNSRKLVASRARFLKFLIYYTIFGFSASPDQVLRFTSFSDISLRAPFSSELSSKQVLLLLLPSRLHSQIFDLFQNLHLQLQTRLDSYIFIKFWIFFNSSLLDQIL